IESWEKGDTFYGHYLIGKYYEKGCGEIDVDYVKAFYHFKIAAEAENIYQQNAYGNRERSHTIETRVFSYHESADVQQENRVTTDLKTAICLYQTLRKYSECDKMFNHLLYYCKSCHSDHFRV